MSRPVLMPSAFHPHKGGVEELTRQLALEQQRAGMSPSVVVNRWPRDLPARELVDGISVTRVAFRALGPTARHWAGFAIGAAPALYATDRAVSGSDLVHVQCVSINASYAGAVSRLRRLPLVVTAQGEFTMDAGQMYQRSARARRMLRRILDEADAVTGCSRYVIDELMRFTDGAISSKAEVVYNGVDVAECRAAEPERRARPYLLGIGRLVPQKGYDLLVQAFAAIAHRIPDHELVVAGDGTERKRLEQMAASSGVGERITFLGPVDHHRALRLFAGADVFALCSRHEPQGIVVLEAMAAGCPVVASRVGGVPEIVDGSNGLTFERERIDLLAERLVEVLTHASTADDLRRRGAETAAAFTWSAIARTYSEIYEKATASSAKTG